MLIGSTSVVGNIIFNCIASISNESISLFPFILFRKNIYQMHSIDSLETNLDLGQLQRLPVRHIA